MAVLEINIVGRVLMTNVVVHSGNQKHKTKTRLSEIETPTEQLFTCYGMTFQHSKTKKPQSLGACSGKYKKHQEALLSCRNRLS